jgi:hypothetical protein
MVATPTPLPERRPTMIIPQALSPVNWLKRVVTLARGAVTEPEGAKALPLVRPCLSELAQPGVELPLWVADCAVARKYLTLLGPLDWLHFPERATNRPWPGPSPALGPPLWRLIWSSCRKANAICLSCGPTWWNIQPWSGCWAFL